MKDAAMTANFTMGRLKPLAFALALAYAAAPVGAQGTEKTLKEVTVLGTAEDAWKQSLGVSTITAEDIKKRPPANDLSEIIRTMPGVNLTGNSTSGQRGNNRQIDLRGMGPENTLILIDGKPASSRNSVRMGWRGERDSRGDSNWVAPELVERIEVIRGPAAARYGNGAAGGVVNIVTQKTTKETHGQVSVYANAPEHTDEGATRRTNLSLSGPLSDALSYRLAGNYNQTDADGRDINAGHKAPGFSGVPAGREGVRNRDLSAQLSWNLLPGHTVDFDYSYGRQGNIYTGDSQNGNVVTNTPVDALRGAETNIITKNTYALTHTGKFESSTTKSYVQVGETENTRVKEGLVGGTEGIFLQGAPAYATNKLTDVTLHTEVSTPIRGGLNQMVTAGVEWAQQQLTDPTSNTQTLIAGTIPGVSNTRSADSASRIASVFAEDNIELGPNTVLTPGIRFDSHSTAGVNWSPALNLTQLLSERVTLKGGIARAYKAPNLYQSNPNYLLYSNSNGCVTTPSGGGTSAACYLIGNAGLQAETSVNKELGIEFRDEALSAGITWFHNDYRNKIQAGTTPVGVTNSVTFGGVTGTRTVYQWDNIPEAVVQGLEGNLRMALSSTLDWSTNFTYLIESRNKTTGDYLSVIPEYTVNTALDKRWDDKWSMQVSATLYGEQKPMKYDFKGNPVSGTSANSVAPYAVANWSSTYAHTKQTRFTVGINNLFDKRQFREGNAVSVVVAGVATSTAQGAGAATYNEPGRTLYVSVTSSF